jgi:hypothetical protein
LYTAQQQVRTNFAPVVVDLCQLELDALHQILVVTLGSETGGS